MLKCTYSLIALIKLDLPLPESPVIAMFTSTSRHFSSLFLKNSSMFDTPLSSISFSSSTISSISHSLKSPILTRDKRRSISCGAEVRQFTAFSLYLWRDTSFVLKLAKHRRNGGIDLVIGCSPAARRTCGLHCLQPLFFRGLSKFQHFDRTTDILVVSVS